MTRAAALIALLVGGCATGTGTATATAPAPPMMTPSPPAFRLPDGVRPLAYELVLDVDPARPLVEGSITIDVELAAATRLLWLNAGRRVHVHHADWLVGGRVIPAAPLVHDEFLGLATGLAIPAGRARLRIQFSSESATGEADGLFRRKLNGHWYLFSHLEPLRARHAFPCFDEPREKAPWRVVVRAPLEYDVLSNLPVQSSTIEPDGRKRVDFPASPPLPSYLVALAVGRFRVINAGTAGVHQTPVRVILPERLTADAGRAGAILRRLLARAEARFATPFPFPKLDLVAVPSFDQGAMENAGLITADSTILGDSDGELTNLLAHELTHQWFGDYVTCAWFDDTWLNESLAEWLGAELAAEEESHFDRRQYARWGLRDALGQDLRGNGRAIRAQPKSAASIMEAFDPYTYARGAALLRMLEWWMGPDAIRRALSRYLAAHAFGSVTTADLASALSAEAGRDLRGLLAGFLDQSGLPLVEARLICAPDQPPRVALRQRPLLPGAGRASWHIPICASYDGQRDCTILDGEEGELRLSATGCPHVVLGSSDDRLFALRTERPANLAELSGIERRDLTIELRQLLSADAVSAAEVMRALPSLLQGPDAPLREALPLLFELSSLVAESQPDPWRRYLRRLGLVRRAHELDGAARTDRGLVEQRDLLVEQRNLLWELLLTDSVDPELAAQATGEALAWLADPTRSDWWTPWLGAVVGSTEYLSALAATKDKRASIAVSALGAIQDQSHFFAAADSVRASTPRLISSFLDGATRTRRTLSWGYRYLREHPLLLNRQHDDYLWSFAARSCDPSAVADLKPGPGRRWLEGALDELALCSSLRRTQQASALAFLANE